MRYRNRAGFTTFLVVFFLALMGLFLAVLGNTSKNFARETTQDELMANCRLLLSSGVAWARVNTDMLNVMSEQATHKLDMTDFTLHNGQCSVTVLKIREETIALQIKSSCDKGRLTVSRSLEATVKRTKQF